ncbi:MAG: hypothetical protein ACFFB2_01165 [Promethearchaeota archaeon]
MEIARKQGVERTEYKFTLEELRGGDEMGDILGTFQESIHIGENPKSVLTEIHLNKRITRAENEWEER